MTESAVDVTILLPACGAREVSAACLDCLYDAAPFSRLRAEVLLSHGGGDPIPAAWQDYEGRPWPLRVHRHGEEGGGPLRHVNDAAARASGRYLCLLGGDVRPRAG